MPVVNINGRPVTVTEEEAAKLTQLSGNERETTRQSIVRAEETAAENYYSGTGQQVVAGLEGLASGATIGLTDLILNDEDTRARARYNPGVRLGTELVGAIAPAILSGGSGLAASVAKATPTALAARAGGAAARGLGRGLPTALAVEGAIQGAGTAASRAVLNNDPLTIEAVISGAGMGGLLGAGVGILSRGAARAGTSAARRIDEATADAAQAAIAKEIPALRRAAAHFDEMTSAAKRSVDTVERAMSPAVLDGHLKSLALAGDELQLHTMTAKAAQKKLAAPIARRANGNLKAARTAMKAKNFEQAAVYMEEYQSALEDMSNVLGAGVSVPRQTMAHVEGLTELSTLAKLPSSPAELVSMQDGRAESYFDSLKRALQPAGDELDQLRGATAESLEAGLREAGFVPKGSSVEDIVDGLAGLRQELRTATKSTKSIAKGSGKGQHEHGFLGFLKRSAQQAAARGASHAARGHHAGAVLSSLAYQSGGGLIGLLASEFMGLRAAATTHVDQLIAGLGPRAASGLRRLAPVSEVLRRSVMGGDEPAGRPTRKTARELAKERADEMAKLAPQINDVAYSAVEPVMGASPEVALAMSQRLVANFQHMFAAAPRDPGGTHVGLKSDWLPSETQALTFASVMEAVTSPMDSLDRILQGDGDPAASEALWACYPSLMQEAAVQLVERLPELQDKTDLATRSALSTAFRTPLDGLLTQQSIAALQATFVPTEPPDSPGGATGNHKSGKANGRPPAVQSGSVQQTRTQSLQASF